MKTRPNDEKRVWIRLSAYIEKKLKLSQENFKKVRTCYRLLLYTARHTRYRTLIFRLGGFSWVDILLWLIASFSSFIFNDLCFGSFRSGNEPAIDDSNGKVLVVRSMRSEGNAEWASVFCGDSAFFDIPLFFVSDLVVHFAFWFYDGLFLRDLDFQLNDPSTTSWRALRAGSRCHSIFNK